MGKTFKSHGYLPLCHSFGSLKKHQLIKKNNRHKKRMLNNGYFNYYVSELEDDSIYTNTRCKNKVLDWGEFNVRTPNKIGYNPNTSVTLQDVCEWLLPNFTVGAGNMGFYPYHHNDTVKDFHYQTEFTNMSELEKLEFMEKYHILDKMPKSNPWFKDLQKMKKQFKRRNAIGYFKGHDKTRHSEEDWDELTEDKMDFEYYCMWYND